MKKMLTLAAVVLFAAAAQAQDANELMNKAMNAYYYPGNDGKADISMVITDKGGSTRTREMVMTRINVGGKAGGDQKYFAYFKQPGDVRETTFMVFKNVNKDDNRWIYVPSVKMVRQISAEDKRGSFMGSDFTYEDVSGRPVGRDSHSLTKEDTLDGAPVYVVTSTPKDKVEYARKITWISKANSLPVKEEYYDAAGTLLRTMTLTDVQEINGFPTPMKRTMKDHKSGSVTVITVNSASYNIGVDDSDFSERRMQRPPRTWMK
jgi:outer membrane lipoprotein-sorting protein